MRDIGSGRLSIKVSVCSLGGFVERFGLSHTVTIFRLRSRNFLPRLKGSGHTIYGLQDQTRFKINGSQSCGPCLGGTSLKFSQSATNMTTEAMPGISTKTPKPTNLRHTLSSFRLGLETTPPSIRPSSELHSKKCFAQRQNSKKYRQH